MDSASMGAFPACSSEWFGTPRFFVPVRKQRFCSSGSPTSQLANARSKRRTSEAVGPGRVQWLSQLTRSHSSPLLVTTQFERVWTVHRWGPFLRVHPSGLARLGSSYLYASRDFVRQAHRQ